MRHLTKSYIYITLFGSGKCTSCFRVVSDTDLAGYRISGKIVDIEKKMYKFLVFNIAYQHLYFLEIFFF